MCAILGVLKDNFNNIGEKIPKDNNKVGNSNKLSSSQNINPFKKNNSNDANNIIDDLIVNQEKNIEINLNTINTQSLSSRTSNLSSYSNSALF